MTEEQWLECEDPHLMLAFLAGKASARNVLLYVCAGVRSLWRLLYDDGSRNGVEVLERAADGQATPDEIASACYDAESPTFGFEFEPWFVRRYRTEGEEGRSVRRLLAMGVYTEEDLCTDQPLGDERTRLRLVNLAHVVYHSFCLLEDGRPDEHLLNHLAEQDEWPRGELVRDLFDNPFRPSALDPAWQTPAVLALAAAAYDNRILPAGNLDPDRLAVLADALEESGCTDANMLGHLRGPGPHVRGCVAVDLLLGKT